MLTPGPSSTSVFRAMASSARACPMACSSCGSQVQAVLEAVGKQVAGKLSSEMEFRLATRRTPCGPSETIISGTPSRSTGVVDQGLAPVHKAAFSSRVIFEIMD